MIILHLVLMVMVILCLMTGIGIAMFWRKKNRWLKRHRAFNIAGSIFLFAGAAMAAAAVAAAGEAHLTGVHHRLGLIALLLICFTLFLAYYAFTAKNKEAVRIVHRWSGRLAFVLILVNLLLGLMMIGIF